MRIDGYCMPGGPIATKAIPYPIGEGMPRPVAPLPVPTPKGKRDKRPDRRVPLTPEQVTAICNAYQAGAGALDIALRFDISRTHVYSLLKAAGIPARKNS